MDYNTTLLLTLAALVALTLLVLAAAILSAYSFTQLSGLVRFLGSLVDRHLPDPLLPPTGSLEEEASKPESAQPTDTPTMPGKAP